MGSCCCIQKSPDDTVYVQAPTPASSPMSLETHSCVRRLVDPCVVDRLVLQMLTVAATRIDSDDESPISLVKLHMIAEKEEGLVQMVYSIINMIPLDNPFGPTAVSILIDDCPLPSKDTIIRLTNLLSLSSLRANSEDLNVKVERNICIVLGCIADKLVGPNSVAVLTPKTLEYLVSFVKPRQEACIVLYALIALEKFAHTTENKITIKKRLEKENEHPLLILEAMASDSNYIWRQVGFCANWALDNLFIIEGRKLSYEIADNSNINAMLNSHDASEYLQISSNGLEARCDAYSFESVRGTFQIDEGCWYYESTVITPGVMQIGWATKNNHFLNDEGYGIGDDIFSLAYDGCRRLLWYNAKPTAINFLQPWRPGDVLGCLIDLDAKEAIFSVNGERIMPCREIFEANRFGFHAAASFMAYQQCCFNFGFEPFKFPPTDRRFNNFNDFGKLTDDEKKVIPRRMHLEQLRCCSAQENSCSLCFDETASCVLEPCGHRGFCSVCISQVKDCPFCRAVIMDIKKEEL